MNANQTVPPLQRRGIRTPIAGTTQTKAAT